MAARPCVRGAAAFTRCTRWRYCLGIHNSTLYYSLVAWVVSLCQLCCPACSVLLCCASGMGGWCALSGFSFMLPCCCHPVTASSHGPWAMRAAHVELSRAPAAVARCSTCGWVAYWAASAPASLREHPWQPLPTWSGACILTHTLAYKHMLPSWHHLLRPLSCAVLCCMCGVGGHGSPSPTNGLVSERLRGAACACASFGSH